MILVTNGQLRQALAITRSLGKKGVKVIVGDSDKISTTFFSKYAFKKFIYPDPRLKERDFLETISSIVAKYKIRLIIPISEECLIPIVKNKTLFKDKIYCPSYPKIMLAHDKAATVRFAKRYGIPVPETYFIKKNSDLDKINNYPVLIKPRFSRGARGIKKYFSKFELKQSLSHIVKNYGPIIAQECLPSEGAEIGYYALLDHNSKIIAYTIQQRLRSYPPEGGPSTFRVTIEHKEIKNLSERLLNFLKWKGPIMIEWKIDNRDQRPKLIELNPRFWGSLALSIKAGVDFPYWLYQLSQNKKIKCPSYKPGVTCRWLLPGDILWFLKSKKTLHNIKQFFSLKTDGYDIIDKSDPGPILGVFLASIFYLLNKKKRKYVLR